MMTKKPQFVCQLVRAPYRIGRYPITVKQYRPFVEAKGYEQKRYWTEAGWAWRVKNRVACPTDYQEVSQTLNHPRTGVCWYEAWAYCRWVSEAQGLPIRLPTEAEWERAARHTDGREFPWGDGKTPLPCNNVETGIG